MAQFNDVMFNGGDGEVKLSGLVYPAFRIAGLSQREGLTPSDDQVQEAIAATNRFLGDWNCQANAIFTTKISRYTLTAGQQSYTIGLGGQFGDPRPQRIKWANIIQTNGPTEVRIGPMELLDDDGFADISVQNVKSSIPNSLYNDESNPISTLYLYPIPSVAYDLELYVWESLKDNFSDITDDAIFPKGYANAITLNLAVHLAGLNPHQKLMDPDIPRQAREARANIKSLNSSAPRISSGLRGIGENNMGSQYNWRTGGYR